MCTLRKVRTIRGCLEGLAIMICLCSPSSGQRVYKWAHWGAIGAPVFEGMNKPALIRPRAL